MKLLLKYIKMFLTNYASRKLIRFTACILLCGTLLLINEYSEPYLRKILYMKSTNIKHSIHSNHSIVINKTIWTNWIKDNRLSTILNSNGNFNEKEIQELYAASRHHTAGARNQNLSVEILKVLGILVQERIERNQNPVNCAKKKKLVINLGYTGYGCHMNFIAMALHEALYAGRTLMLTYKHPWRYSNEGWEKVHVPLSKTCTTIDPTESSGQFLNETHSGKHIVYMMYWGDLQTRTSKVPAGIPQDIAPLLVAVHSRPTLWWHAQFIKYVSRLQPWIKDRVDNARKELVNQGLVAPYVGIHVRRGDKVDKEAESYSLNEYMKSVEKYFQTLAVKTSSLTSDNGVHGYKGRIYLATDDNKVFAQMKEQYPHYKIFVYTSSHHIRYGEDNLIEIIMDLAFLSEADFNVCTMSSNICRRVLDFKEVAHHVDMTSSIHSLDMQYWFRIMPEFRIATEDNTIGLTMVEGDVIKGIKWNWEKGRQWNMGNGYNERTEKTGVYPISKTKYYIKVADFPIYQNIKKSRAETIIQTLTRELFHKSTDKHFK